MNDPLKEIINIVGDDNIISQSPELETYTVEGKKPNMVVFPKTVDETSEIMKVASRESLGIVPWGGGTKIGLGREPQKVDFVLCTKMLNQVVEHEASDLVAITQCGIPLKDFQTVLGEKNQFLAIDPPHVENGATVGGIISTNDSGPRRLRYGTIRELLIGVKVVRSDGAVVKGGAKVVKNVAGYDLPKLYVGSLGTLGIIVEATFRLYPIPEFSQTLLAGFSKLEQLRETVDKISNSSLVPTCLEVLNPSLKEILSDGLGLSLKRGEYALAIRMENVERAVRDQISRVKDICSERGVEGIVIESSSEKALWGGIREFPWKSSQNNKTVCKASVVITDVTRVLGFLEDLSNRLALKILASARAGNGILIVSMDGEISSLVEAANSLRNLVVSLGGNLIVQYAPPVVKSQTDVWGEIGASLTAMKRLKSHFDPRGILNPGRFVGGI